MPRVCTICAHDDRDMIEGEVLRGAPLLQIATRYGTQVNTIKRHRDEGHIAARLLKSNDAREAASADNLMASTHTLMCHAERLLHKAEAASNFPGAAGAMREARSCLELLAKLNGQLQEHTTINVMVNPQFQAIQLNILQALAPFPEAKQAVAKALEHEQ